MSKKENLTIYKLIKNSVKNLRLLFFIGFGALLIAQTVLMSIQSHKSACEVFKSKISQYQGPLSRELTLGEPQVASDIFKEFKGQFKSLDVVENLHLSLNLEEQAESSECVPNVFSASISKPILFANKTVAMVSGTINHYPHWLFLVILLLLLLTLKFGVEIWSKKLQDNIESLVISPIKKLSRGHNIDQNKKLPFEVIEVDRNIKNLKQQLAEDQEKMADLKKFAEISEMAITVAHDIRSPVEFLLSLKPQDLRIPSEKEGLFHNSVQRISDTANRLLEKYEPMAESVRNETESTVLEIIQNIVDEKIATNKEIVFELNKSNNLDNIRAKIPPAIFSSTISNILNNSIESFKSIDIIQPKINVALKNKGASVEIKISDNGHGIRSEHLGIIFNKGITFGKTHGLGLGLYNAKNDLESFGGKIEVKSEIGAGTEITIELNTLPIENSKIENKYSKLNFDLVLIDDDSINRDAWTLQAKNRGLRFTSFSKLEDFLNQSISEETPIFVDYEFEGKRMGINILEKLHYLGYSELYVASGYKNINLPKYVKGKISKSFPQYECKQLLF